jgi:hypothetical protein
MLCWGLFWQILRPFKNRSNCKLVRLYTGMYNWTFSECYFNAVMMVRHNMRLIICIDMRFSPICTVGRDHGSCHIFSVVQLYTGQSARSKSWSQVKKMHPPTCHGKSSANFCSGAEIYSRKGKRGIGVIGLYFVQGVSATCVFLACVRAVSTTSPPPPSLSALMIYLAM